MAFGPMEMQHMGQILAQLMAENTLVEQRFDTKSIGGPPEWHSMKEEG